MIAPDLYQPLYNRGRVIVAATVNRPPWDVDELTHDIVVDFLYSPCYAAFDPNRGDLMNLFSAYVRRKVMSGSRRWACIFDPLDERFMVEDHSVDARFTEVYEARDEVRRFFIMLDGIIVEGIPLYKVLLAVAYEVMQTGNYSMGRVAKRLGVSPQRAQVAVVLLFSEFLDAA